MQTLTPSQTFTEGFPFPLRIMAIAEGYVMAHFKGCTPFVESVDNFAKRLEIAKISSQKIKTNEH